MGLATTDAPELGHAKVFMAIVSDLKQEGAKGTIPMCLYCQISLFSSAMPPRC
ncbi:hypothetical protein K443DRAFT_112531 [Laccaria amethystina LaAM-08-1]|uniref:Unplaced genomic scaffold K443scaffold_328, whole genome shotgun sequence n=1 Tax=Laccaria amethystina LaAM-08-1 TaxID=1095629 RepID=A0A0C9XA17_9AGAR|nr:hypothetical protein K443DRAFT_112531 [Laccaria amethystina LaAM-08-1]